MARSVVCAGGCGMMVRLSNGTQAGTCAACRAEQAREARRVDEARQRKLLRTLVRQGELPKHVWREMLG